MPTASRITIGRFAPEDVAPVFRWMSDAAAARLDFAYRPIDMITYRQWWQSLGKDQTEAALAIRKTADLTLLGYLRITGINGMHRSAEIGIRIGEEDNRSRGYGKEALSLAIEFCWNHLDLNRIQLTVFRDNARAIRACQAVGFRTEGVLKKAAFVGGRWVDVMLMAALRPAQNRPQRVKMPAAANLVAVAGRLRALPGAAA